MGAQECEKIHYWRKYFSSANCGILEVIENAILVAASDCPEEFRSQRCSIAEKLFASRSTRCLGCDQIQLHVPAQQEEEEDNEEEDGEFRRQDGGNSDGSGEKGSKVNSCTTTDDHPGTTQVVSNYSYGEAEALTEEIEENSQIVQEVLRIEKILTNNNNDESEYLLFQSLKKLQVMELSVETLQATEIGKAVSSLKRHKSKQIRNLVRALIYGWKEMVDEWVNATGSISEATPESMNPSFSDHHGLPLPPLDGGAFLTTRTNNMELSQFFEGMDDDGNLHNKGEFDRRQEYNKKHMLEDHSNPIRKNPAQTSRFSKDNSSTEMKCFDNITPNSSHMQANINGTQAKQQGAQNKESQNTEATYQGPRPVRQQQSYVQPNFHGNGFSSGPIRPFNQRKQHGASYGMKNSQRHTVPPKLQSNPPNGLQDHSKSSSDNTVREKLEIAKRKLHERYQEAENAKKQRTIQVMEMQDLPKPDNRQPFMRPGHFNRQRPNGRR